MSKLFNLKLALLEVGLTQYEAARRLEMSETRLSRIMCGRIKATPEERRELARLVGKKSAALFQ